MKRNQKKRKVSQRKEDKISNLPNEIIDHILDYLPIHDAARTTVLSKQWKHVWPMYPKLIFDKHCFEANKGKLKFHKMINNILLQHKGPVLEFFLDLVCIPYKHFSYVDHWLVFLTTTAGVKKLSLMNSSYYSYTVMSSVISCSSLEHLELNNVRVNTACRSLSNLTSLSYEKVVSMSKPSIDTFKDSLLNPNMKELNFQLRLELPKRKDFDLSNLLEGMPNIVNLRFDSYALKFLGADTGLMPRTMEHLEHLSLGGLDIKDLDQVSAFVCLLQSCPNLRLLDIKVLSSFKVGGEAQNRLKALECKEPKLNFVKLKTVKIILNPKSTSELILLKLMLSCSPCLDNLTIETNDHILILSRASRNANIKWRRYRKRETRQQ